MTLAEMRAEVKRRIEEDASTPVFWTDTDIDEALQAAADEWADLVEYNNVTISLGKTASTMYYDLRNYTAAGETFLRVDAVWNSTSGMWLNPKHLRDFDFLRSADWDNVTGQPDSYFSRGLWWLGLWPAPTASDPGGLPTITILARTIPAALAVGGSPSFPADYHYALVEYAHYDLLTQDKEPGKAMPHYQNFQALLNEYREFTKQRAQIDRVPVMGVGGI